MSREASTHHADGSSESTALPPGAERVEQATGLEWSAITASRTLAGERGELRSRTAAEVVAAGQVAGLSVGQDGRESNTPERLYWRTRLGEGVKLEVAIEAKKDGKCLVTLTAERLVDDAQREAVRADLRAGCPGGPALP